MNIFTIKRYLNGKNLFLAAETLIRELLKRLGNVSKPNRKEFEIVSEK